MKLFEDVFGSITLSQNVISAIWILLAVVMVCVWWLFLSTHSALTKAKGLIKDLNFRVDRLYEERDDLKMKVVRLQNSAEIKDRVVKRLEDKITKKDQPRNGNGYFASTKTTTDAEVKKWKCVSNNYSQFAKGKTYTKAGDTTDTERLLMLSVPGTGSFLVNKSDFESVKETL
jgi:hypothetical protein